MRKSEIVIKPVHIVLAVLALVILLVGGYAGYSAIAVAQDAPSPEETAARDGALAFLNRDVDTGMNAWVEAVCRVSTKNGCEMMRKMYAPAIWPSIEKDGIQATCKITTAELAGMVTGKQAGAETEIHVWKLSGSCAINGANAKKGELYVMLAQEDGTWKFDHLMTEQEVKSLSTAGGESENQ